MVKIYPSIPAPTVSLTNLPSGYKIFLHDPNEMPEMSTIGMAIPVSTFAHFQLTITSVWTPPEVKSLTIKQRHCKLVHEANLKESSVYSHNVCKSNCRRRLSKKLCKCVPFYYQPSENQKICDLKGMQCLFRNKDHIISLNNESCNCIQNCDIDSVTISKYEITDWFLGTNAQWKVVNYPTVRYKRSLIFSSTNALVQIGGIAGLLLGCSVLSLIELLYFITLRLYWGLRGRSV